MKLTLALEPTRCFLLTSVIWWLLGVHQVVEAGLFGKNVQENNEVLIANQYGRDYELVHGSYGSAGTRRQGLSIHRSIESWELVDFLLVGTIDGSLHARDRKTGIELWSIPGDGPLVTVKSAENPERGFFVPEEKGQVDESEVTWIVEPLDDGILYYFTPVSGLQKLPVSIKQLVLESPFAINGDDKIYTGSRNTTLYRIDANTGTILHVYGDRTSLGKPECKVPLNDFDEEDEDYPLFDEENRTFMIGRTDYHLEIHGKNETIWKVTFSSWGPNNMDGDLADQHITSPDSIYVTPVHNSSILALSTQSKSKKPARWVGSIPSMAVTFFDVLKSTTKPKTEPLVLLPQPEFPFGPPQRGGETYIERTKDGQWFALSGKNFPSLVNSAPVARWITLSDAIKQRYMKSKDDLYKSMIGVHTIEGGIPDQQYEFRPGIAGPHTTPLEIEGTSPPAIGSRPHSDSLYVHPPGTSEGRRQSHFNRGEDNAHAPPLISPPPPPPPSQIIPSGWHLIGRLIENLMSFAILVIGVIVAARFGWMPQLTETLTLILNATARVTKQPNEALDILAQNGDASDNSKTIVEKVKNDSEANQVHEEVDEEAIKEEADDEEERAKTREVSIIEPVKPEHLNGNGDGVKKKRKRGSRGGRKNASKETNRQKELKDDQDEFDANDDKPASEAELIPTELTKTGMHEYLGSNNRPFDINEKDIIGWGSHGTIVYKGRFENRDVAVKRMLLSFCDIASQEVALLQESDDHPNVIRYFCKYQTSEFLFIALELCPGSLEDIVEHPEKYEELMPLMNPKQMLYQIASGVAHLHSLKIVHRDIKPQNILVAPPKLIHKKLNNQNQRVYGPVRMVISDFGLCKKLEGDQSSFRPTTAQPAGTAGWIAPEVDRKTGSASRIEPSGGSSADLLVGMDRNRRLTRAVDIFSLGCVFYYVLSRGHHPFGINSKRESNIDENQYNLDELGDPNEIDSVEAQDLIEQMIQRDPKKRPDATQVLLHPYFWSSQKKLDLLYKVSDWIEGERRDKDSQQKGGDGRDKDLEDARKQEEREKAKAEHDAKGELLEDMARENDVCGKDWHERLDSMLEANLRKFRTYEGERVAHLLRAIRNKSHHYNELPDQLKRIMPMPDGYLHYFTQRFPHLLITIYYFAREHLRDVKEKTFEPFFNPEDQL
ncbi:serine/threonine-protein kinase/endoribonuclease Ire1p [Trichomonascus vanleenenianus]|uniref:bifunctional endoribonuclease/protein kinase IRE1 n=1 Tax=Trichomonascus vanleenenianus TaxID=2268995 RepID=UPI003ECAEA2B